MGSFVRSFVIWETHPSTDLTYKRSVFPLSLVHSPIVVVPVAETAIAGRWMAVLTRIASRSQVHRQSPSTAGSHPCRPDHVADEFAPLQLRRMHALTTPRAYEHNARIQVAEPS